MSFADFLKAKGEKPGVKYAKDTAKKSRRSRPKRLTPKKRKKK